MKIVAATKRYVADERCRLRLFEALAEESRRVLQMLVDIKAAPGWSEDEFRRRVGMYDESFADLCRAAALIGRWGSDSSTDALTHPIKRLCDGLEQGGNMGWLRLQWYPALLLFYAGGIGAVTGGRYDALMTLMHAAVRKPDGEYEMLVTATTNGVGDGTQLFKLMPGLDRHYLPCSEHLHARLGKLLNEVLHLGSDFDASFDTFEILRAIEYAHLSDREWGPVGRFAWRLRYGSSAWQRLMTDAQSAGNAWPPLAMGLCGGSSERLTAVRQWLERAIARHAW
jgi:hypothetical protein